MKKSRTTKELKDTICREIVAILRDMIQGTVRNFSDRLRECICNNGSHLDDVIFQT